MTNEKVRGLEGNKFYMVASNRQPIWLAEIKGTDPKFGLKREFVPAPERGRVNHEFELDEDTYYAWNSEGYQEFGHFVNGEMEVMTKEEMMNRMVAIENGTYKEEVAEPEEAVEEVKTEEFNEPVYLVNDMHANEGIDAYQVRKAIVSMFKMEELKYTEFNEYKISDRLNKLESLKSWAHENYEQYPIKPDFTEEAKEIYARIKPGQAKIPLEVFKALCMPIIREEVKEWN